MGMGKKRFNWKARERRRVQIDDTFSKKIKLDINEDEGKYDESNPLVLPSEKRPTKKLGDGVKSSRILSKKQRKKLEKVVEKKKKKADRASLLEALAKVQAPVDELSKLTSVASVQTKGLKRHFMELESEKVEDILMDDEKVETTLNSISGSKKRKRILRAILAKKNPTEAVDDPNIVGCEASASSGDDSNAEDEAEPEETAVVEETDRDCVIEEEKVVVKQEKEEEEESEKRKTENGTEMSMGKVAESKPAVHVDVFRDAKVQEARLKLPILAEEQMVMEAINENDIVVICGETGSGKTTQVPQFLYEAGYASDGKLIGITQPRRVAAISMAKRVGEEMNLSSDVVSFLIRFEGNVTNETRIKYMTDGVLLKEIQTDFMLSKYSVVVLDEAHERNVYTDILIGLLSRIVPLRKKKGNPLKLVIMSATLRVEDFTENTRLFKAPPPVVKIESRQFPVSVHFNKRTPPDYLRECYFKTCKIHIRLPEGGILVFVTGQQEVKTLVRKLKKAFPTRKAVKMDEKKTKKKKKAEKDEKEMLKTVARARKMGTQTVDLDKYSVVPNDDTELDLLADDDDDDDDYLNQLDDVDSPAGLLQSSCQPLWVLPLYSLLPSSKQAKVFEDPPEGCRLCVVATNVAETSLTIPNIKYIVDSGKMKKKVYDKTTGVTSFEIAWCSKASANQRAGRAGRVGPGHCYRLYSSAVFNDEFPQFSEPEIMEKPVDDLVLQMKSMNIVKVINFPFPTRPDMLQLKSAEKRLRILGALEDDARGEWSSKLTKLGETMASFPVSPRFAKMLALSCQHDLVQYVICIVAALSVQEVLLQATGDRKWAEYHRKWAGTGNSLLLGDVMVLLRAVGAAACSKVSLEEFCSKNGLRHKAVVEIMRLRAQLTNQINVTIPELDLSVEPNMKPPTDAQTKLLRQIILAGMADHVARKIDPEESSAEEERARLKRGYRDAEMEEPIFVHSSSVLKKEMPEWIVYQEVYETNKMYMRGVTAIEPEWLPVYAPNLCRLSEPMSEPAPRYDEARGMVFCHVNGTFGRAALALPTMEIPFATSVSSYKWFSVFFLSGEVFPRLKAYARSLLSAPACMTKSWARLVPRTKVLLQALISREANTRDRILEIWKEDKYYLLDAYKSWLPDSAHESVTLIWPPA